MVGIDMNRGGFVIEEVFGEAYEPGEPVLEAAISVVSHAGAIHLIQNVLLLLACLLAAHRLYSAFSLLPLTFAAPLGNWIYAHTFETAVIGGSLGTFAMLGACIVLLSRRHPRAAVFVVLGTLVTQPFTSPPTVIVGHLVSMVVGIGYMVALRYGTLRVKTIRKNSDVV